MSNNYRWKDKYYDVYGNPIDLQNISYHIPIGTKGGDGSKGNPYRGKNVSTIEQDNKSVILASGYYDTLNITYGANIVFGQDPFTTIINTANVIHSQSYFCYLYGIKLNYISSGRTMYPASTLKNCILNGQFTINKGGGHISESLITYCQTVRKFSQFNNSVVGIEMPLDSIMAANCNLFSNCDIIITSTSITDKSLNTFYLAFSNCRFKIGDEVQYTYLTGNTEEELRADFAIRCEAQGIVVPEGSEYNEPKMKLYRWVFSNDKNDHGYVIKDSIIDKFQQRRMVRFGWKSEPVLPIEITTDKNKINSLSNKTNNLVIDNQNGSVRFSEDVDIAYIPLKGQQSGSIRSNIIWLGEGKQKLDSINITHNLATQYGVMIDSDPSIIPIENGSIEAGQMYLVRTKHSDKETITYNGVSYSTALSEGNNIFVGVTETKSWDGGSQNIIVYKITDLAISNTIRMRIVDEIPKDTVTSLTKDVWYFVEPNNIANPTGSVKYKGVEYPCFGSFKAEDETSFDIIGECRLRRCWKDTFDPNTDPDKSFWQSRQKPIWFDVVPDDMRCILKKNNPLSVEIESDHNGYITSGHPDFYALIRGDNGAVRPAYDITGKYLQLELVISTLNPM